MEQEAIRTETRCSDGLKQEATGIETVGRDENWNRMQLELNT